MIKKILLCQLILISAITAGEPARQDSIVESHSFDVEINPFALIVSGISSSAQYHFTDDIAVRLKPVLLWRIEDQEYYSINIGLKNIFWKNDKVRWFFLVESGYYDITLKKDNDKKNLYGYDLQFGIGFHWLPLKKKTLGTTLEFTYSVVRSRKIFLEDYVYKDVKPLDGFSPKISIFF